MDELLRLTRENNEMLKRICQWLDKIESPEYRDNEDFKGFFSNFVANIAYERFQCLQQGQPMEGRNPINQQRNISPFPFIP